MTTAESRIDPLELATRIMGVLNRGRRTSTYKLATLRALIQYCAVEAKKHPPGASIDVEIDVLAADVIDLYWRQVVPAGEDEEPLRQSSGTATILNAVKELRDAANAVDKRRPCPNVVAARHRVKPVYDATVDTVRGVLLRQPLPKLQHLGSGPSTPEQSFLYDETEITGSSRVITLKPGVGHGLAQLALVINPVIENFWADDVWRTNDAQYRRVKEKLFGYQRMPLGIVGSLLKKHFGSECFYCQDLVGSQGEIDHVLPWSILHIDGVANLVVACRRCNSSKSDSLPDLQHVHKALSRDEAVLNEIAAKVEYGPDIDAVRSAAISLYAQASAAGREVWRGRQEPVFIPLDLAHARDWMSQGGPSQPPTS